MYKLTLTLLVFCLTLFKVQFAAAGDFAEFRSLGFSPDGSIYAYEQYGIQDGSGFPYAERYFINVINDTYVQGTPFKVRIDDENAGITQARNMVIEQSADLIDQLNIKIENGRLAAFNPSTELSGDALKISYHSTPYEPNPNSALEVSLETLDTIPKPPCSDFMENVLGFRLKLKTEPNAISETIYEDKSVPKSRLCPTEYRMGGVVTYEDFQKPSLSVHVFLVLVKSFGFEGPDGRWIAIPKVMN